MQKRYPYNLSHQVATFSRFGNLIPWCSLEVAPGDTFSGKVGMLVRLSPLKHALLTDIYVDSFLFYVPHRLVWDEFEDFVAAGPDANSGIVPPTKSAVDGSEFPALRYTNDSSVPYTYSALRLRAYNLIYNEFFRDDEQDPYPPDNFPPSGNGHPVNARKNFYSTLQKYVGYIENHAALGSVNGAVASTSASEILRAIAQQKAAMRRATYGTRYVDILRSYGINVNYQMLQRPEVVAVGRGSVNVTDVRATGSDADLGKLAGHGVAGTRVSIRRKSFPEHGTLIGVSVVRPDYQIEGLVDWFDSPRNYESYYDPGLVPLPPVSVECADLVPRWDGSRDTVIGYTPWGNWYRNALSWNRAGIADWVPDYRPTQPGTGATWDTFTKIEPTNFDNVFKNTTFGHFQMSVVNRFKALRLIPRHNVAAFSGTT